MELKIQNKLSYERKIHIKDYNTTIKFLSKKQMKTIYPINNYRVVGEIGNKTGTQCGAAENLDGKPLPIYKEKTHNKLTEAVVGYTEVDENIFLAVVENILIRRMINFLIVIALLGGCITLALNYQSWLN